MDIILTILSTLLATLVEWYIKYEKDKTFYNNEFLKLEHRLEEISNQISYTNQITTVEHPYFKKEIDEKMKEFLSIIKNFYRGFMLQILMRMIHLE